MAEFLHTHGWRYDSSMKPPNLSSLFSTSVRLIHDHFKVLNLLRFSSHFYYRAYDISSSSPSPNSMRKARTESDMMSCKCPPVTLFSTRHWWLYIFDVHANPHLQSVTNVLHVDTTPTMLSTLYFDRGTTCVLFTLGNRYTSCNATLTINVACQVDLQVNIQQ